MAQTKYDHAIDSKDAADQLVEKTSNIQGVKWVNVNVGSSIVVTHDDSYDEEAFKAAAGI
ncbi:hypothetical protein [Psychrobacter pygoscelis]|uniref:hypothetical protein n=1 Tax=Psychrobacter pygoscelis TaxID=2488563 RepID=UPI00103F516F|nr:hypothetical protein [Psychrobacter pygoscelis]